MRLLRPSIALIFAVAVTMAACAIVHTRVRDYHVPGPGSEVNSPAKAHLLDGSTVVYAHGFSVQDGVLRGSGVRYGLTLRDSTRVSEVSLDSVAGVEAFESHVDVVSSAFFSLIGTAFFAGVTAVAAVAIFGSCPTVYADSAGTPVLEAEGFSYSIAPLFEARDVDRLRLGPGADGVMRLEVRNEAAETHFINDLSLLAVPHGVDEDAAPDPHGLPIVFSGVEAPIHARDRTGRDLRDVLSWSDGRVSSSAAERLASASADDPNDALELDFAVPPGTDSAALVLRARNSGLTSELLYNEMLEGQGPRAIDWMNRDLARIDDALALGKWYVANLGLHVAVRAGDAWQDLGMARDVGPIAWKDFAIMLPVHGDSLRVRLTFLTDAWRFDRVVLAINARRATAEVFRPVRLTTGREVSETDALAAVLAPDARYLQTTPGQRFEVEFDTGTRSSEVTWMLEMQGYYIEWMRPEWMRAPVDSFVPSRAVLGRALARWRATRDDFERRFHESAVPVR